MSSKATPSLSEDLVKSAEQLAETAVHARAMRDMQKEAAGGVMDYLSQAGGQAMDFAKKYPEPLIGAAGGALLGGGSALMNERKRRNALSSALTGAMAGGLGGVGAHLLMNQGGGKAFLRQHDLLPVAKVPNMVKGRDPVPIKSEHDLLDHMEQGSRDVAKRSLAGRTRDLGMGGAALIDAGYQARNARHILNNPLTSNRTILGVGGNQEVDLRGGLAAKAEKGLTGVSNKQRAQLQSLKNMPAGGMEGALGNASQQTRDFGRGNKPKPRGLWEKLTAKPLRGNYTGPGKPALTNYPSSSSRLPGHTVGQNTVSMQELQNIQRTGRAARQAGYGGQLKRFARPLKHNLLRGGLYGGGYAALTWLANLAAKKRQDEWAKQLADQNITVGLPGVKN